MSLKIVKRCKLCGHKLDNEGACLNNDCVSHILDEIEKSIKKETTN